MKTRESKHAPWIKYLTSVWENQPSWLDDDTYQRLTQWKARFDFYSDIDSPDFKNIHRWRKKKKLRRQGNKLVDALCTLQQLPAHYLDSNLANEIKRVISNELTKLEITQLEMIEKAQKMKRFNTAKQTEVEALNIRLQQEKAASYKSIKSHRYSKIAKNDHLDKDVSSFFSKREGRIHFRSPIAHTGKFSTGINFINNIYTLLSKINNTFDALAPLFDTFGRVLVAIPFIGSIAQAIPVLIKFAKVWWQDKSTNKKVLACISVALVVASTILLGFSVITASAVALGLMVFGAVINRIKPWIQTLLQIRDKKNALTELKNAGDTIKLTPTAKQLLLIKLEQKHLQGINVKALKKLILNEKTNLDDLLKNEALTQLLECTPKEFLQTALNKRKQDLQLEIAALRKVERNQRYFALNSMLTIIGSILILIPPTMIAGAAIIVASSLIGIALSFDLGTKIENFVRSLFKKTPPQAARTSELKPQPPQSITAPQPHPEKTAPLATAAEEEHDTPRPTNTRGR